MVEILCVFAFDDVVVEKTSAFYIHWNQYYILTYLRINCLHTLELLISISDVLEVELNFFLLSADYVYTQRNRYMYEILLFVEFVLNSEGAAMLLLFYFIFFLYQKNCPNLNQNKQPTMAKTTKNKTLLKVKQQRTKRHQRQPPPRNASHLPLL